MEPVRKDSFDSFKTPNAEGASNGGTYGNVGALNRVENISRNIGNASGFRGGENVPVRSSGGGNLGGSVEPRTGVNVGLGGSVEPRTGVNVSGTTGMGAVNASGTTGTGAGAGVGSAAPQRTMENRGAGVGYRVDTRSDGLGTSRFNTLGVGARPSTNGSFATNRFSASGVRPGTVGMGRQFGGDNLAMQNNAQMAKAAATTNMGNGNQMMGGATAVNMGSGTPIMNGNLAAMGNGNQMMNSVAMTGTGNRISPMVQGGYSTGINGMQRKRGGKGWKILLVFGLAAVVGVAVFAFLTFSGFFKNEDTARAGQKFNEFLSYVVSGTKSDAEVTEGFNGNQSYYFISGQTDRTAQEGIYAETDKLLTRVIDAYGEVSDKDSTESTVLKLTLRDDKQMLDFMKTVYLKDGVDGMMIVNTYLEEGRQSAIQTLSNYYNFPENSENTYINDFRALFWEWVDLRVSYVDIYGQYGCINDGVLELMCLERQEGGDKIIKRANETINKALELYNRMQMYYSMDNRFILGAFRVNSMLNGGYNDDET